MTSYLSSNIKKIFKTLLKYHMMLYYQNTPRNVSHMPIEYIK